MSLLWRPLVVLLIFFVELIPAQDGPTAWRTTPFNPSALPLTLRNPYLNTWLAQGSNPEPITGSLWAVFWSNIVSILGQNSLGACRILVYSDAVEYNE